MRVFTIGYEGATQPELVAALKAAGVERVIDVRAVPLSRKPGFSKNVLAAGLAEAGIGYVHLKALGTPPAGREAARKGRFEEMARIYAAQLDTPEAAADAARLRKLASEKPSALLCFERDPAHCHRTPLRLRVLPDAEVVDLYASPLRPAANPPPLEPSRLVYYVSNTAMHQGAERWTSSGTCRRATG